MRVCLGLLLALLPCSAVAAPIVHVCDTGTGSAQSLLQGQIYFAHDAAQGVVIVNDAAVAAFNGGPIDAQVSSANAIRLVF